MLVVHSWKELETKPNVKLRGFAELPKAAATASAVVSKETWTLYQAVRPIALGRVVPASAIVSVAVDEKDDKNKPASIETIIKRVSPGVPLARGAQTLIYFSNTTSLDQIIPVLQQGFNMTQPAAQSVGQAAIARLKSTPTKAALFALIVTGTAYSVYEVYQGGRSLLADRPCEHVPFRRVLPWLLLVLTAAFGGFYLLQSLGVFS